LRGVGPKLAEQLAALGIKSVADLLFHLPLRYQDRTRITLIRELAPGMDAVVEGRVLAVKQEFGRRRSLACTLQDPSGILTLRFFHFSGPQQRVLEQAGQLRCYGEARRGRNGVEMFHPEFRVVEPGAAAVDEESLTPVYPTTEGLHQASYCRAACCQATCPSPRHCVFCTARRRMHPPRNCWQVSTPTNAGSPPRNCSRITLACFACGSARVGRARHGWRLRPICRSASSRRCPSHPRARSCAWRPRSRGI
jgi:ATP-dependent DNA helicase RecG